MDVNPDKCQVMSLVAGTFISFFHFFLHAQVRCHSNSQYLEQIKGVQLRFNPDVLKWLLWEWAEINTQSKLLHSAGIKKIYLVCNFIKDHCKHEEAVWMLWLKGYSRDSNESLWKQMINMHKIMIIMFPPKHLKVIENKTSVL